MKRRRFCMNTDALSLLYDTVFFLVCISLSGVILLPVFTHSLALDASLQRRHETVVDDALQTYLVSRVDTFDYVVGASFIDTLAEGLGINTSSAGLYQDIRNWILAREQRHKTHAQLLGENLACQFQLPLGVFGTHRGNVFTSDFDTRLIAETQDFFSQFLGARYHYHFTAQWHPIRGIGFGGNLSIGNPPPFVSTYVAQSTIIVPYTAEFTWNSTKTVFSSQWLKTVLQDSVYWEENQTSFSSIPLLNTTITLLMQSLQQNATNQTMHAQVTENISSLAFSVLCTGIHNETHDTVFPGVLHLVFTYSIEKITNALRESVEQGLSALLGGSFDSLNTMFFELNTSIENPIVQAVYQKINESLQSILDCSFESLSEAFYVLETRLLENSTTQLKHVLGPHMSSVATDILDYAQQCSGPRALVEYYIDRVVEEICRYINLNTAEVRLCIWEMRA